MLLTHRLKRRLLATTLPLLAALCFSSLGHAQAQQCIASNNVGADERSQHHLLAAREQYLACASATDCPSMVRDECQQALAELKLAIPTLVVSVVDQQKRDLAAARLSLDGRPILLDGRAIEVDPGLHQLVAEQGALRSELDVMATEGEANRRVELTLAAPDAKPLAAPLAPDRGAQPRSKTALYAFGGTAVLGAAGFTIFSLSGHSQMNELEKCKPYCATEDVQSVRTKYLLADISLAVGVVALGATIYTLLSSGSAKPAQSSRVSWDVAASKQGAALGVRWRN
jgi:hypothetical protein